MGGVFLDTKPPKLLLEDPGLKSSSKTPAVGLEHCPPFSDVTQGWEWGHKGSTEGDKAR